MRFQHTGRIARSLPEGGTFAPRGCVRFRAVQQRHEDRMNNRTQIIITVVVIVLLIIGYTAWDMSNSGRTTLESSNPNAPAVSEPASETPPTPAPAAPESTPPAGAPTEGAPSTNQ